MGETQDITEVTMAASAATDLSLLIVQTENGVKSLRRINPDIAGIGQNITTREYSAAEIRQMLEG